MEGVRSEMLKAVLRAQEDEDQEMADGTDDAAADVIPDKQPEDDAGSGIGAEAGRVQSKSTASDNAAFLASRLRFEGTEGDERCVDSEGNGVMMGWELPIMEETARLLCLDRASLDAAPAEDEDEDEDDDYAVLNVGFGLGLVDKELQKFKPKRHTIIEPHPDVLAFARSRGWYERKGVTIFEGTWQEYIKAFEAGDVQAEFDAIYVSYLMRRLSYGALVI